MNKIIIIVKRGRKTTRVTFFNQTKHKHKYYKYDLQNKMYYHIFKIYNYYECNSHNYAHGVSKSTPHYNIRNITSVHSEDRCIIFCNFSKNVVNEKLNQSRRVQFYNCRSKY